MKVFTLFSAFALLFLFSVAAFGTIVTTTLDTTAPPANPAYTAATGQQTGRLNRDGLASNCDAPKANPGSTNVTGARRFDSYVFVLPISGCVAVSFNGGLNLFAAAYNSSGFVPGSPAVNYLGDPGVSSGGTAVFYLNVVAGQPFTVVVSEVDPGGGIGTAYTLGIEPATPRSLNSTLGSSPPTSPFYSSISGTQTGRIIRNGVPSDCRAPKTYPGTNDVTPGRRFEAYTFTASRTGCVTVTLSGSVNLFSVAYNGFDPVNVGSTYLADSGFSATVTRYAFRVIAGQRFTIVVHEVNVGAGLGTPYNLRVAEGVSESSFDFDGDFKADIGIFRPGAGEWWINRSSSGTTFALQFGLGTDLIVPADYTGDARADIAVWRGTTGEWFILRSEDFSYFSLPFGASGDIPAPADYDADGKADFAVFRPSSGTWFVTQSTGGPTRIFPFGVLGDVPVVGDYDGDGRADAAIFRPGPREWWINRSTAGILATQFGNPGDKAVQGDYTGDGKTDIAIWRPPTGEWFIVRSENSSYFAFPFGTNGDVPAPADYDGDGKFDATVFRPSQATWFVGRSMGGPTLIVPFGLNGDRPVATAFVP